MLVDLELRLLHKDQKRKVNIELVASLGTFQEALLLCKSISMLEDTVIAERMGMTLEEFVAIWSGDGHFPMNKLIDYMKICENIIPLLWLALKCGYNLKALENEMEQEIRLLQGEIDERQQELNVLREDIFGGLIERLRAEGSKEADRVAQLIDELKRELGR
jgi:hypothetical protein